MSGTLAGLRRIPVELWGCLLLGLGALGLCSSFVTDDALITLRHGRMLAEGHGLRFNPDGPPVEGYSNFSHVLLGALAARIGVGPLELLRLVNWLALPGLVWLAHTHARALGCGRILAALAARPGRQLPIQADVLGVALEVDPAAHVTVLEEPLRIECRETAA